MDTLSGLLDGPRASEAFLLRVLLDPPWSIRIQDEAPLTLLAVGEGTAWVIPAEDESGIRLDAGDVALVRGPKPYVIADDPMTEPQVIVNPGQLCTTLDGRDLIEEMGRGLRTWGNSDDGACKMLVGIYESQSEIGSHFVSALPRLTAVRADEHRSPLLSVLGDELTLDGPGQGVILNRLLDLLVISTARVVFARAGEAAPGWFQAQTDPAIGQAITAIYDSPEHPWTVSELANRVGMSRAAFAHRFKELVGESPIAFLTGWRISLAADVLRSGDDTVATVSTQVGYSTPYAFSSAFKRVKGVSPTEYRHRRSPGRQGA